MDTIRKLDLKYQIGPKPIDENDKKSDMILKLWENCKIHALKNQFV